MSIKSRERQRLKEEERNKFLLARDGRVPTKEEARSGMVFTPPELVNQMMDELGSTDPATFTKPEETFCDPACGTGNFIVEVLKRKMANGISHLQALKTIFGIDICQENVDVCRQRLSLNSTDETVWFWLKMNIICADALNENHIGWKRTGYMWSNVVMFQKLFPDTDLKEFDNVHFIRDMEDMPKKKEDVKPTDKFIVFDGAKPILAIS